MQKDVFIVMLNKTWVLKIKSNTERRLDVALNTGVNLGNVKIYVKIDVFKATLCELYMEMLTTKHVILNGIYFCNFCFHTP